MVLNLSHYHTATWLLKLVRTGLAQMAAVNQAIQLGPVFAGRCMPRTPTAGTNPGHCWHSPREQFHYNGCCQLS